jgi:hypothetical protein
LLAASGFQVLRVIPTEGPDLVEASLRNNTETDSTTAVVAVSRSIHAFLQ